MDGVEALEAIRQEHFDAALIDIHMPRMDGLELTRAVRSDDRLKGMPLIVLTADAVTEHINGFRKAGANEVITKPVSMARVDRILSELVGQR